jgi:hypothetical protein
MPNKQRLQGLLTEMLASAEAKDQEKTNELSTEFDGLLLKTFSDSDVEKSEYDNCRQSCVVCLTFNEMYERCLADAKERYTNIMNK